MEVHGEYAEPTALGEQPPPSGKLNKTAFKLFKRRRSGGAMPSIFGVRSGGSKSKSGEGGGGPASSSSSSSSSGMVRSKTHDGLAEAALESGKKDGPAGGRGTGDEPPQQGAPSPGSPSSSGAANAAAAAAVVVGKAPRFFSLLRKNGRPGEGGPGERPKGRGGLKGLFSSMRWPRRDNHKPGSGGPGGGGGGGEAKEEGGGGGESPPSRLLQPGSLTASLECIKEEAPPPPLPRPPPSAEAPPPSAPGSPSAGDPLVAPQEESPTSPEKPAAEGQERPPATPGAALPAEYLPKVPLQGKESRPELAQDAEGQKSQEDNTAITGCGDIIADQEEDMGGSSSGGGAGGRDKTAPGLNKAGASKKPPSVVAYQGGGEEMASPEQVEDTCTPEFWDMLSQTEEKAQEAPGAKESPKASKDGSLAKREQNGTTTGQHASVSQIAAHHNHKEDPKSREKEQQEAVPSSDEGYWDSTTPGPEEDNTNSIQKEVLPRDSYSGDALYDLYAEPEENTTTVTSAEDVISVTCCKPVSPVTTTCPVKTHTTSLKDSKIPISIKHFTSPHGSHGPDASNSHHIIHHQPTKSEVPRTKIPVSKVLVHRASYRSLAGTTGKIATYHESAKK
ncbi:hypothetical protein JRQ81_019708 [Phrynocephalus forsythii]|uniref:APC membrane recruitment protein 2 n=1 Tax=Phrynocephalus forsythii TaxID=171643 RepID=A0A9Q1AYS5_9SAUR|nr:hypothetical protein JRQ81_019708 [Phrynocephalus forsythii]